ncbi:NAD(P)H-dependent glycerol-3-phosphate dehydrogenase [Cytophagales bacterium LB-30]|uniref:Glycerol-3-phosphate dehydrogenase [NAD(P)+] n=1 Tax=Shiella aurantiaca TaxID=3058365 RepID=A0ABT8F906_9BACT|nr:NAD(P)H-dependent glycerol-3-phosphate dehydrogenase [Shiella aurantiaca]MDN4166963.1 NAD(P)H-dependent glycerol-3-phosphate dehydrogenase [Shiella aurantiaca]
MASKNSSNKPIGVVGSGSFGAAVANLLAQNNEVLMYARRKEVVEDMLQNRVCHGHTLHERITPTNDLKYLAEQCEIIFPVIPSANFREMMKQLSPYLHPYHMLIHGTKGLDTSLAPSGAMESGAKLTREHVKTMSEVIREESVVVRIGCLAGPNLARELADGHPAATVVASHFDEVIHEGQRLLRSDRFQVYGSADLIGIELCGVLKNIIAIASGALSGMDLGENARALLISRGMVEMIYLGRALGGNTQAFIGLAGVGDLVATCSSKLSRNYSVGFRLAKGEKLNDIIGSMDEIAEGVNTVRIMKKLADHYKVRAPITEVLHKVLFEDMTVQEALQYLMKFPLNTDIDFI